MSLIPIEGVTYGKDEGAANVEMDTGDHRYHSGSRTLGYGGVCGGQD